MEKLTIKQLKNQAVRLYVELTNELNQSNTDLLNDLLDTESELNKRKVKDE